MTSATGVRPRAPADPNAAVAAVTVLAAGVAVTLAGAAAADPVLEIGGGVTAGVALTLLIAWGWIDGMLLVAVSLPLPAFYSSETLRVAPVAGVTAAAVIGWALRRALDGRRIAFGALPRKAVVAVLAAVVLSAALAHETGPAVRETLNLALLLAFLVAATDELITEPHRIRQLVWTLTSVIGVSGALALVQGGGGLPSRFPLDGSPFQRATLGFGWPNELGMFLGLGLPLCVCARDIARGRAARMFADACLASGLLGLVASFSRGSWLAVVASTLVLPLIGPRRFAVRVWLATLGAAVVLEVVSGGAISGRVTSEIGGSFIDQRAALMLAGVMMFLAHPVLGVGPGGFPAALSHFGPQIPWLWDYVGSAHNAYVHMAAETGIVGLTAVLFFFGAGLVALFRGALAPSDSGDEALPYRRAAAWGFAMACLMGMVEWVFAHGIGELIMLAGAVGFALRGRGKP